MADRFDSYDAAFYMSGSAVMVGAAIPFMLLITKRRETGLHLEVNSNMEEAGLESPCDDITRSGIEASPDVSESELSSAKANRLIGKESVENESNAYSPQEDQLKASQFVVVNEAFTMNDEDISNSPEMRQVNLQAEDEVNMNSPLSPSVTDKEEQTAQDLEYNTRM